MPSDGLSRSLSLLMCPGVQLAKLLRSGGNVLLMDEPTNDLDVDTSTHARAPTPDKRCALTGPACSSPCAWAVRSLEEALLDFAVRAHRLGRTSGDSAAL